MCWKCGTDVTVESVYRNSECPVCHKDLHSCRNCVFYEPGSFHDCRESAEDLVADKEKANFCDAFRIKRHWGGGAGASSSGQKAADAKKAFDALFG